MSDAASSVEIDLRGIPCPVNWARAKVRLENAARGTRFAFLVDDPRSARHMPAAAEACGYAVVAAEQLEAGCWRIAIEA